MSTNDVPGSNPAYHDELHDRCWAEHDDGSLLFLHSVEGGTVVYSLFDTGVEPPVEYRDSMAEKAFKKQFTWSKKAANDEKWTWHDKTSQPWDRLIDMGAQYGTQFASADDLMTAAQRVAKSRGLRGGKFNKDTIPPADLDDAELDPVARKIIERIQTALSSLLPK